MPESLHKQARELAKQGGGSINQLVATASAEKLATLITTEYLEERAKRGSREEFERALSNAKPIELESFDRL